MTEPATAASHGSHYGQDMLQYCGVGPFGTSAFEAAVAVMTHGRRASLEQALGSLGIFDRAAFDALSAHADLPLLPPQSHGNLTLWINVLGRLSITGSSGGPSVDPVIGAPREVGVVEVPGEVLSAIEAAATAAEAAERRAFEQVHLALTDLHTRGTLGDVVEGVIDHVEHVEAVAFYLHDRFFARIERFNNLTKSRRGIGALNVLRGKPYEEWSPTEILLAAALHALFISGRAVRFEEFNGKSLSATALWQKLEDLEQSYDAAADTAPQRTGSDLFTLAARVRAGSERAVGSNWLRYRSIYGLTFLKNEKVLASTYSPEDPRQYLSEFGRDFELMVGHAPPEDIDERHFFTELGRMALERDMSGVAYSRPGAAQGWMEYLIERLVLSAVIATDSDYGMSSSLRDLSRLADSDAARLDRTIAALEANDFFTCFVAMDFEALGQEGTAIAASVQRRMMFNRWHFIPGNLSRERIAPNRHWYYPPVLPDIAVESHVHHAGHARATVKYSIRAPGPDMSIPALTIADQKYRGFYDVRVVRMDGDPFTIDDMLRTRRRTLWMGYLFEVAARYAEARPFNGPVIIGFQPGAFLNVARQADQVATTA